MVCLASGGLPSISWVAGRTGPEMALWSHAVLGVCIVLIWCLDFLKTLWAVWLELLFLLVTNCLNLGCPDFSVHVPHGQCPFLAGQWLVS